MTIRPMESFFIVKWEASGPITGSYDASDGAAVMNVNLTQTIEQNGSSCSVGPVPVTLSTESTGAVISGSRFEDGLEGPGALVGSWTSVPEPGGPNCDLRKLGCRPRHSLLKGDGAFGMARDRDLRRAITDRPDMTIDKFGIDGYEDEGGCWGKRPDPEPQEPQLKIELSRLSISKSAAKFAARVTNRGGVSTDTELCAYATHGLRFTNPGCLPLGSLANGASVQRRLKVTIPKGKKARARALRRGRIKVRYVEAGIPGLTIHRKITSAR